MSAARWPAGEPEPDISTAPSWVQDAMPSDETLKAWAERRRRFHQGETNLYPPLDEVLAKLEAEDGVRA